VTARSTLERVTRKIVAALGSDDCVLVGGLAVGLHGHVRATDDVDLVVRIPLATARQRLEGKGLPTTLRRGDVLEGDFPCLHGEAQGIRFDVLPPLVPLAWEKALAFELGGMTIRVVDLDGLLHLKLKAQGPQDLLDVAMLVLLHPDRRERALELALAYGVGPRLESLLAAPRLRAKAREQSSIRRPRSPTSRKPRRRRP
jgi:hypothetical protein